MKKITLFILLFHSLFLSAQSTFEIQWEPGAISAFSSPIVEIGDTVIWIWTDNSPKTITALPGGREIFDSGILESGVRSYAYTFSKPGVTRYENEVNPAMNGKITVVNKMSREEKFQKNLKFYPNPVNSQLNISSPFSIDSYEIYNALGTLVLSGKGNGKLRKINMSNLNSGLYFIRVFSNNMHTTLKVTKN